MRLSEKLKREAETIWEKIYNHPFVIELYKGTLPLEKFRFYVIQDYNYLIGMTKTFSILASRARDYELMREALEIAHIDATIEMENYKKLLDRIGLTLEEVLAAEPAPTNRAYMNHLITTCSLGSIGECLAAVLPCFWTYMEIPRIHGDLVRENRNEIYREWISAYESREYIELTHRLIDLFDKYGSSGEYERLKRAFITSSRYEWMFWDMSYRMEKWPV
jgi:thiaminase/transcriptional activator TenA